MDVGTWALFADNGSGLPILEWSNRLKIAVGSARGLTYLHEDCHPRIIHRDIKSANILLDSSFEAQVADFGFAKLTNDAISHVSTRVMGTFGLSMPTCFVGEMKLGAEHLKFRGLFQRKQGPLYVSRSDLVGTS